LACIALLPGLPFVPFALLSAITGYSAWKLMKSQKAAVVAAEQEKAAEEMAKATPAEEPITAALAMDQIRLELGYGLLSLVNDNSSGVRLTDQIKALRRQLATDSGFRMPSVRILDNMAFQPNTYAVVVKETEVGRGDLRPEMLLVMHPSGERVDLPGEGTREPAFGLPALWVDKGLRDEANFRGYTVVDAPTVITTHLTEAIKENIPELLSYAETQKLLDELAPENQKLVADPTPSRIQLSGVQRVLQNLLGEQVSIRDLPTILEGIAEAVGYTQSLVMITEHVRARLARQICSA